MTSPAACEGVAKNSLDDMGIGLTKHCIHRSLETGIVEAMQREAFALELTSRSADFKEGLLAFQERRPARFQGQ